MIESRNHALECADAIQSEIRKFCHSTEQSIRGMGTPEIDWYFKSSFDKANRTSIDSYRGPGLERGLDILQNVKTKFSCKIITDIHSPDQAAPVAKVADMIQIPAFLCRQTDLLVAAGKTGIPVNIKKGQFMAPEQMEHAAKKVWHTQAHYNFKPDVLFTERGTSFGYGDLVVDFRSIVRIRKFAKVIFDATHSVQQPGGKTTGGQRDMIPYLVRAAKAVGIDGLFVECHPDPDKALSDAGSQWPIARLGELLAD